MIGNFHIYSFLQFLGNKAKGQISKQVFQENKAHEFFRKQAFLTP